MATTATMVMRCGNKETPADEILYSLITSDYQTINLAGKKLKEAIANKTLTVLNMDVVGGKLVSTNGALDNYPLFDPMTNTHLIRRAVILERIEIDNVLRGYMVFTADGIMRKLSVKDTLALAGTYKIANGKIFHTQSGDIISSINGSYPIAKLSSQSKLAEHKKADAKLAPAVKVLFISAAIGRQSDVVQYAGMVVESTDAAELAEVYERLSQSNKKVMDSVNTVSDGKANLESFKMISMGATSFYGVFDFDTVVKMIQSYGKLAIAFDKLAITCLDYSGNLEDESKIEVGKDLKVLSKDLSSQRASKALRAFSEEVLKALNKVKGAQA